MFCIEIQIWIDILFLQIGTEGFVFNIVYLSTLPVCLTAFWIDDIITAQKNTFDADTLDGCLHFVCNFDRRTERTLTTRCFG